MNPAKSCAIYCRFSSEQQRDRLSIEAQSRLCTEHAQKQGWKIYKVYVDKARSGTSDNRPAFQEMIAKAADKTQSFQVILVHKLDRFARSRYDSIKYKHILRKLGIRVASVTQPMIGSGDPTEVILESVLEGMDEFYSINLAREAIKGMSENARRGWWCGGHAPYGYRLKPIKTEKGLKQKLEIDRPEEKVIKLIYSMYLGGNGNGAGEIRNYLNNKGMKCRGGYPFNKSLIIRILSNEKYVGDIAFGKDPYKKRNLTDFKLDKVTIKDTHEPIIDRKQWNRVQELLARRNPKTTSPRASASDYLFSGLIRCKLCNSTLVGAAAHGQRARYRYYVCNSQVRVGPNACKQRKFNADTVERVFVQRLKAQLTTEDNLRKIISAHNETLKQAQAEQGRAVPRLKQEIVNIDQKRNRLFEAIEDGLQLTKEDVAPRLRELTSRKDDLERELEDLERQLATKPIRIARDGVKRWVDFYEELFSDKSIAQKNLVQSLVTGVEIGDDKAVITYNPNLAHQSDTVDMQKKSVRMKRDWLGN